MGLEGLRMSSRRAAVTVIGAVMAAGTVIAAPTLYAAVQRSTAQEEPRTEPSSGTPPRPAIARQASGPWPENEPAGMTLILNVDGSSKMFGPGYVTGSTWLNDERVRVVRDPTSKHGHAIEKRFFVGDNDGWHGAVRTGDFGSFRELYVRQVFRVSQNWQWHRSGGKYFYYGASGRDRGAGPRQFILAWGGSGETRWIDFGSGVGEYRPNGGPKITKNRYHTIEIHHVASTSGANGSLRMWIDGVEIKTFNLVGDRTQNNISLLNREWRAQRNLADKGLTGIEAFVYWGGQGDSKRVNDWIRLSELYISGKK